MNREEFISYLESRAEALRIPLHRKGEMAGLPRKFHHALAVAHLLVALGQPAPSAQFLRTWYRQAASASPEAARWVYGVVGSLRNPDVQKLKATELVAFSERFRPWGGIANGFATDRARKSRPVNPT
jgi:hypothetical protein